LANKLIEDNIDYIENNKDIDPPIIEPFLFSRNKDNDDDISKFINTPLYYEQIVEKYKEYDEIILHTKKEEIHTVFDKIDIECPHIRRQVEVRALLNSIGCPDCEKDRILKLKIKELLPEKITDFSKYNPIELIDESSDEFKKLKTMDRNRKKIQNEIINKLKEKNCVLITPYKNFDAKLSHVCEYGHTYTTSWNALKKLEKDFCRPCRNLQREIQQSIIKKQATEEDLVNEASNIGWKHIRKTNKDGLIEWQCPNGHIVCKVLRELKRGFCGECNKD
jgi:hypothetical protein